MIKDEAFELKIYSPQEDSSTSGIVRVSENGAVKTYTLYKPRAEKFAQLQIKKGNGDGLLGYWLNPQSVVTAWLDCQ